MVSRWPRSPNRLVGLVAAGLCVSLTSQAFAWGWIGHRLITHMALEKLPPEVRALYNGQEAALDSSTVHPDQVAMVNPHEAMRHFVNVEVLDPAFVGNLAKIAPLPPEPPRPAPGQHAAMNAAATGAAETAAAPHHGAGDDGLRQAELSFFPPLWPIADTKVDSYFASLPGDGRALEQKFSEAALSGVGTVDFQPAICFRQLVLAIKGKNQEDIVYWTGKLSHYLGDAHQPLHNTVNHDGKISGNVYLPIKGQNHSVHSRFEAAMLKFMGDRLDNAVRPLVKVGTPLDSSKITAMSIAASRASYGLIQKVLDADAAWFKAHGAPAHPDSEKEWEPYFTEMEKQVGPIAISQLGKASQMLADALVAAFQLAGAGNTPN